MKQFIWHLFPLCLLFLAACGSQPVPKQTEAVSTGTAFQVPDPCSSENLPTTVKETHDLMRVFDEASQRAPNLEKAQLPELISNLQRIRRNAEDTQIPVCLETLKTHQLNHMNMMIQTLLTFVDSADQEALKKGLDMSGAEHDLYSLEYARLLGTTPPISETAQPSSEP